MELHNPGQGLAFHQLGLHSDRQILALQRLEFHDWNHHCFLAFCSMVIPCDHDFQDLLGASFCFYSWSGNIDSIADRDLEKKILMADNEMLGVIAIGLCIFAFLAALLIFGSFYGDPWQSVAQGVAKFILIITVFAYAVYVLFKLAGRR